MVNRRLVIFLGAVTLASVGLYATKNKASTDNVRRALSAQQESETAVTDSTNTRVGYLLPESAKRWCEPSQLPPPTYRECDPDGIVNQIHFIAGLTNGLKMMLLNIIQSFEDNRCFFLDESYNRLLMRNDKSQELDSFLLRYFEPMGLDKNDPIVIKAIKDGRVEKKEWKDAWNDLHTRRLEESVNSIESLGYKDFEGHYLKKIMMMRVWRPKFHVRHNSCKGLESMGLRDEFMAWSLRRGDKGLEGFSFTTLEKYYDAADKAIRDPNLFNGTAPTIFVATDDCSVIPVIRKERPQWTFVTECDNDKNQHNGFVLADMKDWNIETTDEHFRKFFTELYALAAAKYYIGVAYTNVAWWAYFMRPHKWAFELIDYHQPTNVILRSW